MNFLLIILLTVLLIAVYHISGKEICSPSVLFVAPFIIMCIVAQIFQKEWSYSLHWNTFLTVLFGNICFCTGAIFLNKVKLKNCGTNNCVEKEYYIKSWKYIALLCLQIICYLAKVKYILNYAVSHGVAKDLSKAIAYINNITKFTTEESISYPRWLSLGLDICTMFGFICACILAQQLILKHRDREHILLVFLNFVVAVIGGSTSGGRGGTVQVLIVFLCAYLILYQRKNNWKKPVPIKKLFMVGVGLLGIVGIFIVSITLIGRNEIHEYGRYLSTYVGAQIFNLDYLLNNNMSYSTIFGQETFYPIIQKVASLLGVTQWSNYHVGYDSVYAAGYSTGNVYTCFYSYVKDFSIFGVIIVPFLLGVFSQVVYRYARSSNIGYTINPGLVLYSNIAYMVMFSYFADKFGSLVFTFNYAKKIVILFIVYFFLVQMDIKGSKIVYRRRWFKFLQLK